MVDQFLGVRVGILVDSPLKGEVLLDIVYLELMVHRVHGTGDINQNLVELDPAGLHEANDYLQAFQVFGHLTALTGISFAKKYFIKASSGPYPKIGVPRSG
jgi:hypothetical protein